jgi:hypothetical protein
MSRRITFIFIVCSAVLFGLGVPLLRLFDAFQPLIVALSIVIAALLVRLNRGMPSLEWSALEVFQRTQLTTRVVELSLEYCRIVAINAFSLVLLVSLTVVGKDDIRGKWPSWTQQTTAGAIGALIALGVVRMAYVVWRDYDIVKLQKYLIDTLAARRAMEDESRAAADKIADIRSSGVRRMPTGEPRAWGE